MPGATVWFYAPLTNAGFEHWRMVAIVTGYTLFVTSQYDIIFPFANQRFGEVCWHNMHSILHELTLLVVVQCITRHTIRPILAGTVPVLRVLSRPVNQNVPVSHSVSQDSPTQWRSEAKCRPGPANKVPPFPHLKFTWINSKSIKINVNSINTCTGPSWGPGTI